MTIFRQGVCISAVARVREYADEWPMMREVLFDFGRGEAFAATTRLFSFGGGVPLPELEPPAPLPLPSPTATPPPPLVAGRVTVTVVELAEPGLNVEAVEGRSLMVLEFALSCRVFG